jgi:3-hydroxyacyl-[acyl-carrier-protein] dehydratase
MSIDIQAVLPHRYPFLLVDAFVSRDGNDFECLKNVSFNEPFFQGHFPGEPVMPGVLIIEALAQAAAVGLAAGAEQPAGAVGYLTGIEKARFRRKVVPGDQLRLTGTIIQNRRGLVKVQAVALVGSETAAEAALSFIYSQADAAQ